ncbi:hypothetical protein SAMN02745150_01002 [Brevinema andersonii]|uniref:SIMPL domain-containing protein n=1 Tax=Brevinema andersonii TaxID=34097 RepID=A0A1I1EEX5_BREAD|nr:SIMPL domain-containing protein [Brevinema andersonii]SFB83483.1 hypothetical protein SAMN02745150_01002 [Brevinema andersonii]
MNTQKGIFILSASFVVGLVSVGLILRNAVLKYRAYERTVQVKGLAEREYNANVVMWTIGIIESSADISLTYSKLDRSIKKINGFLTEKGIASSEISFSMPTVVDRTLEDRLGSFSGDRYAGSQAVIVYSTNVPLVQEIMPKLSELGKEGIAILPSGYEYPTEYLFTALNDIKPEMIQEATANAREAALKFAQDSKSKLGKIKKANQGQFIISDRDQNNPHLKIIRIVVTIEYYLSD